jgi:hypothetical protein
MFEIGQPFEAVTDVRDHLILLIAGNSCAASETFGLIWAGIHEHEDLPYFEIQNSAFEGQFYGSTRGRSKRSRSEGTSRWMKRCGDISPSGERSREKLQRTKVGRRTMIRESNDNDFRDGF